MAGRLTDKQKRFADEYLIDLNATQAAIRAGYSPKTANEQGARLLANVSLQDYLGERMEERKRRTEITQDMVLRELAAIGFSNVTDIATVEKEERTYQDAEGEEQRYERVAVIIKETAHLTEESQKAISSIKQGKNGIEVKLYDKVAALEKIGKHLGMFRGDDDGQGEGVTIIDDL